MAVMSHCCALGAYLDRQGLLADLRVDVVLADYPDYLPGRAVRARLRLGRVGGDVRMDGLNRRTQRLS